MIKQFQLRILKLEQALAQKDKQFQKKKELYQKVIEELQYENEKLKSVILEMNNTQSQHNVQQKSANRIDIQAQQAPQLSEYEINEPEHHVSFNQYSEIVKQNNYLKQQIAEISTTYQRQIQQITLYFDKIKTSPRLASSYAVDIAQNQQNDGKVSLLINAYENLLKSFDSERQKYGAKIQELSKYIIWEEEKNLQLSQQNIFLQKKLKNSQQKLNLFIKNLRL